MNPRSLWKNDFFQTVVAIGLVVAILLGVFYGLRLILNTPYPVLTVESGSMCISLDSLCDGWSHPFAEDLHIGDILIVQGVDAKNLNANYPNSDRIVFHKPGNPEMLIVHRIVGQKMINGTIYFQTKGDGNGVHTYPAVPSVSEYDPWNNGQGVPQDLVVGKVVGRIPWFGHLTLLLRENPFALPVMITLICLLVILEFVLPQRKSVKQKGHK